MAQNSNGKPQNSNDIIDLDFIKQLDRYDDTEAMRRLLGSLGSSRPTASGERQSGQRGQPHVRGHHFESHHRAARESQDHPADRAGLVAELGDRPEVEERVRHLQRFACLTQSCA